MILNCGSREFKTRVSADARIFTDESEKDDKVKTTEGKTQEPNQARAARALVD
jgi:hypothetical protein